MKKMIITLIAAFFGFITAAVAQVDTTGYTNEPLEQTDEELDEASDEMREEVDEAEDAIEESAEETGEDIEEGAEEVGEEVDESADAVGQEAEDTGDDLEKAGKTGEAHIKDERLESKEGPNGETIFIDEHGQYYYISSETGERIDAEKSELRDKD